MDFLAHESASGAAPLPELQDEVDTLAVRRSMSGSSRATLTPSMRLPGGHEERGPLPGVSLEDRRPSHLLGLELSSDGDGGSSRHSPKRDRGSVERALSE